MSKFKVTCLVLILCFISIFPSYSNISENDYRILYISSYSPSFLTFSDQIQGLEQALEGMDYYLSVQYMNSKDFYSESLIENFKREIDEKMTMISFDALVVADDNAYNFALSERKGLFKDLPIVFLGVNNEKQALKANNIDNITGVIEHVSIKETLEISMALRPDASKIYFIADPTPTGQYVLSQAKKIMKDYPNYEFVILDTSIMDFYALEKTFKNIQSEDIILLLSLYRDYKDNTFNFLEGVNFVLDHTSSPVFHLYKPGISEGLIGGHVVDHIKQGYYAGELLKEYFKRNSLENVSVIEKSPNAYYFNGQVMDLYGLSVKDLPENAIIINEKENLLYEYRYYVIGIITALIMSTMLILYLVYNLNKRREYESEIIEKNKQLERKTVEIKNQYSQLESIKRALLISESRYKLAFEGANSGLFDLDFEGNDSYIYAQWYNQFLEKEVKDNNDFSSFIALIPVNYLNAYHELKEKIYKSEDRIYSIDFCIIEVGRKDKKWIQENGVIIRNERGKVKRIIGSHRDITYLKENIQRVKDLKVYDQLTKLYNRSALEQYVTKALENNQKYPIAIIILDIDDFKNINDQYGHPIGDEILKSIAYRMMQNNSADYISRFGGDEFVLIMEKVNSIDDVIEKLYEIKTIFDESIMINDVEHKVSASLGVVLAPDHGKNCHELISKADLAMYEVKKNKNIFYKIYDESIHQDFEKNILRIKEMKNGINSNEFYMVYHPVVDTIAGKLFSVESLMRWKHDGQFISPNEFIPLAEKNGLIGELTSICLEQSLNCLKYISEGCNISINLSPLQLKDPEIVDRIESIMKKQDLSFEKLIVEITETAVIENFDETVLVLERMKALGIRIALDDFGTGYSSLSYLTQLPVDIIKIDKDFTQLINRNEKNMDLIQAIIAIARNRQLNIVFEGVETKDQLNYIIRSGCRYAQGYYYYKPMGCEDLKKIII